MDKKVKNAWAFYDWANSVYSLVISTAVFPIYFAALTSVEEEPINVEFLGLTLKSNALYTYSLSFSFVIVALLSPFLSGIADHTGSKKKFLRFFCYLGSLSCAAMFFFNDHTEGDIISNGDLYYGLGMGVLASVGFWGSIVFYNAFLPEVATPEEQDALSAKGFSLGYIGSSILLIIILAMTLMPTTFGLADEGEASRLGFLLVGIWWFSFAQISLRRLPDNPYNRKAGKQYIWNGFKELQKVWVELKDQGSLRRFLYSFFFFSMGVQTVILLASMYGTYLGIDTPKLITTILIIQFVAIGGSYLFAFLSKKFGNLQAIKIAVVIWAVICGLAYTLTKEDPNVDLKFYGIGAIVGLVMGGIQSISRSTYSKLLREDTQNHASYFSLYDVSEKIAIVFGTATFGALIEIYDGDMKASALSLMIFFVIGYLLLMRIPKTKYVR